MIGRYLPKLRLFGWHGTDIGDENDEAHGLMLRISWFSLIVEIGVGRVLR